MKKPFSIALAIFVSLIQACNSNTNQKASRDTPAVNTTSPDTTHATVSDAPLADAATILARKQVPILCYHHITDKVKPADYTVSITSFNEQLKTLADSGYHSILPDQLYDYLTHGTALPEKPFMLTFDDTRVEHFTVAAEEMKKYNFKGVFFIMTIAIGKPNYMSSEQIKNLADNGHVIASHTWDHHNVKTLVGEDWQKQLDNPKEQLEKITGKPINYFAYPFGVWNDTAVEELKKRNVKAAFQLTEKRKETDPLYTIRRMIVAGGMKTANLLRYMRADFR